MITLPSQSSTLCKSLEQFRQSPPSPDPLSVPKRSFSSPMPPPSSGAPSLSNWDPCFPQAASDRKRNTLQRMCRPPGAKLTGLARNSNDHVRRTASDVEIAEKRAKCRVILASLEEALAKVWIVDGVRPFRNCRERVLYDTQRR